MKDANIFMIYADETGKNVTLSGRSGVGNKDPVYPSTAQISLLDGSGIADGKMTANVRCMWFCSSHTLHHSRLRRFDQARIAPIGMAVQ